MRYAKPIPNSRKRKPQNTQIVKCPICKKDNLVFCWSFSGSGKKCQSCKFLMTRQNIGQFVGSLFFDLGIPQKSFRLMRGVQK